MISVDGWSSCSDSNPVKQALIRINYTDLKYIYEQKESFGENVTEKLADSGPTSQ